MISVTILVKNSQKTLEATLRSVERFPEVLVLDTGSTDHTLEIARRFPFVTLYQAPFEGFGVSHNRASSLARFPYIFSLDSDEVVTPELADEILSLSLDPGTTYSIRRQNYFRGKHIKGCAGWHPDVVCRIYSKEKTCFDEAQVHEKIIQGSLRSTVLQHPILHTPYHTMEDFLQKMQSYSSLFAKQHQGTKKSSLCTALAHSFFAFWKNYIGKKGFIAGKEGLIISLYNAHVTWYKYLKLAESNALLEKTVDERRQEGQ